MGILPDWLQEIVDTAPEGEAQIMLDKKPYRQVDADRRYRAKQKSSGIVRKTIRVPAERWEELQEIAKAMREEMK